MSERKGPRFRHDLVIYSDRLQNEDLGTITVTDKFIEFVSDDRHLILELDRLQEAKIERDVVKILDTRQEIYLLKFLERPPYQKWYSKEVHYDIDEPSSRRFLSLIYSMMKVKKAGSEKEKVIIKEVVLTPCKYCGGLIPQTALSCPQCGAKKK